MRPSLLSASRQSQPSALAERTGTDALGLPTGAQIAAAQPSGRPLKVMLAIDGLGLGGAEVVVSELARSLNRDWFQVCVCCTRGLGGSVGEALIRDGIDVFVLPGQEPGRVDYLTARKFRHAVVERKIDIVHTHAMAPLLDSGPCRLTLPRLRTVHTFHYGNYPHDSWRYHIMEGIGARLVDRLVAVGWEQRRALQRTYYLKESRIQTVWNGVADRPQGTRGAFRTAIGVSDDRLLVGTIAKLIEQKGLDTLLDVARRCRDNRLPLHFAIVGEGPLRGQLEEMRRTLGLEDTVTLTGWIPDAASRALPDFDVFFQPSRWEAMSIAVLEAMVSGKAIVATRVGDNSLVLEDGISGLLVNCEDTGGMVAALTRVLDSPLRHALGAAARTRFDEGFSLDRMIRNYERLYLELAGSQPSRRI